MSADLLPFAITDTTTTLVDAADLGKRFVINKSVYRLVKAASTIAGGSNGLQVSTALSAAGVPTFAVSLNVTSGNHLVCGAIPSTLTGAIAASGFFLALIDGSDSLATTSSATASLTSGTSLQPGTASDLVLMTTGAASADLMLALKANCGFQLIASTGTSTIAYLVSYRAPLR